MNMACSEDRSCALMPCRIFPLNSDMKSAFVRLAVTSFAALALAIPLPSHAWFFFFIPLSLFTPNDKKTVEELEKKGDWKGLLEFAETRLSNDEKNPAWLYLSGLAFHKLNRIEDAIGRYQKALDVKPDYKEAQLNLGICYLDRGGYDKAIATFIDLIGKAPEMWQPYYNAGLAYVRKQDPINARVYLEQLKTRNMVWAGTLENNHIKPLEYREEQHKLAIVAREKEEQERVERERQAREEADAKLKAEAESKAAEEQRMRATEAQEPRRPGKPLEEKLKELKQLYTKGLLTKDVYEASQRDLLKSR
jgi:tetratricopeptide (TPR) repeat protein